MGARASGPKPWVKLTLEAAVMHRAFHSMLQLRGSCGSSDGCGTKTCDPPLTKWCEPTSVMTSVPGKISVLSSCSSSWSSCDAISEWRRTRLQTTHSFIGVHLHDGEWRCYSTSAEVWL